ncbi:MAG: hypothetical protein EP335_11345 [Alphaproteobacteria bacterium]|nr:MAG: hypothetical protein EP335_11345 [Alphaproteobacteria bacterium]
MQIDEPIWTSVELGATCGALMARPWYADGLRVTSRGLLPGDLFIALDGVPGGGHDAAADAIARGAIAALVHGDVGDTRDDNQRLVHVADTGATLRLMAAHARDRAPASRIVLTGGADANLLRRMLDVLSRERRDMTAGEHTVPLTLARLPRSARFGVFDLAYGDAVADVALVKPHVMMVGCAEGTEIGEAFEGLAEGSMLVIDRDRADASSLVRRARRRGVAVMTVSLGSRSDVRVLKLTEHAQCTCLSADIDGVPVTYKVGLPGRYLALKSLMLMAAVKAAGGDLGRAAMALAGLGAGRDMDDTVRPAIGAAMRDEQQTGRAPTRALMLAE